MGMALDQVEPRILEDNLALARRFIEEVLDGKNPNAFDELVADDITVSTVLKPNGRIEGKAEYVQVLSQTVSGKFTNRQLIVEEVTPLIDGRVLARLRAEATHVGEIFGIPATNRRLTMHELHVMRFRHGKLAELLVAGLNPLEFEMLFAPAIAKIVLGDDPSP